LRILRGGKDCGEEEGGEEQHVASQDAIMRPRVSSLYEKRWFGAESL